MNGRFSCEHFLPDFKHGISQDTFVGGYKNEPVKQKSPALLTAPDVIGQLINILKQIRVGYRPMLLVAHYAHYHKYGGKS